MNLTTEANTNPRVRSVLTLTTVCAIAATGVNLVLWGVGRAAGASLMVDPGVGAPDVEVGALKLVVTTLLPFAVGVLTLSLAARWSRRSVVAVTVVGGVLALASAVGPLDGGHDTATGVLLATMHLTTGAAFLAVAGRFRAVAPTQRRAPA